MAVQGACRELRLWGEGETSGLLSRKKALWLGMKMQDPALPAECWVSIIQRCSVTTLYLCPSSVSHHYLISNHRAADRQPGLSTTPGGRRLLKFYVFAFDYCGYSSDPLNASHLANLPQGQRETVWSTAGQTGSDIWGRGTLVPVRPHTDPMKDHRSKRYGEQESD